MGEFRLILCWVCDCVDNMLKCPLLTYYQDDLPLHKTAASGYLENYWALVQINFKKKKKSLIPYSIQVDMEDELL